MRHQSHFNIYDFRQNTSLFREHEETRLRINIQSTNDMSLIFNTNNDDTPLTNLQELVLETFDESIIINFVASEEDGLTSNQRRFLGKLKRVLRNNDDSNIPNNERYISDLASFLCEQANLDEGLNLKMEPCLLRLAVGEERFTANVDKVGQRGEQLIWLLQVDAHRNSTSYKHGDLQLACAMIAAIELNYILFDRIRPSKLVGMKFMAGTVYFYSMKATEGYINELLGGLPQHEQINIHRFPQHGFSLADPTERKEILKCLSLLYREALSID
ncbi:uncharacterized protein BX664DRAFT_330344 [Halteromyces radiatus]|uniref:uncharacterized protein n=1 Tax=Halteromyces radiatus TaxID=101107 RepID=UPI00221F7812|nr:uncharacterized protein BX664DRAFT_330344 [Halteromyces radiatus]KAI8093700.1 hypothetical protein BX664DRAFT_330344 [Halteromyces radiatus]